MKSNYVIVGLILSAVYGILVTQFPDIPLSEDAFQAVIFYILVKLGVDFEPAQKLGKAVKQAKAYFAPAKSSRKSK